MEIKQGRDRHGNRQHQGHRPEGSKGRDIERDKSQDSVQNIQRQMNAGINGRDESVVRDRMVNNGRLQGSTGKEQHKVRSRKNDYSDRQEPSHQGFAPSRRFYPVDGQRYPDLPEGEREEKVAESEKSG